MLSRSIQTTLSVNIFEYDRYEDALGFYAEALKIKQDSVEDDSDITRIINNLGQTLCALKKWDEATKLYPWLYL